MPQEIRTYPPKEFSSKYERIMAPTGLLVPPKQAFKNKSLKSPEDTFKKAFKIILKRIRKMSNICGNCFETSETRIYCEECDGVWYCDERCMKARRETHGKVCCLLQNERVDQIVECFPSPVPIGRDVLRGKGGPVKDWEDWFNRHTAIGDRIIAGTNIVKSWWQYVGVPYQGDDTISASLKRILSNVFSTVLTIGHSPLFFSSDLIKNKSKSSDDAINIHLIGADQPEMSAVQTGLIHIASRILKKPLIVTLVAPDLSRYPQTMQWSPQNPFQASPQVKAISFATLYHEFWKSHVTAEATKNSKAKLHNPAEKVPPPDVALAIHPGVHTKEMYKLWRPTLNLLAENNIPIVMTTYNEAEFETTLDVLHEFKDLIIKKGRNEHGSLQEKQTPYEADHTWAVNSYIIAIDNKFRN